MLLFLSSFVLVVFIFFFVFVCSEFSIIYDVDFLFFFRFDLFFIRQEWMLKIIQRNMKRLFVIRVFFSFYLFGSLIDKQYLVVFRVGSGLLRLEVEAGFLYGCCEVGRRGFFLGFRVFRLQFGFYGYYLDYFIEVQIVIKQRNEIQVCFFQSFGFYFGII